MPQAEHYNVAKSGAGQMYIAAQLDQHNRQYKFNEDDLIVIMYSTFYREDRYVYCGKGNDGWKTPGNIYTQSMYDDEFIDNWADPRGYIIRDLALMSGIKAILEQSSCDSVTLSSIPVDVAYNERKQTITEIDDVIELHRDVIDSLQRPLLTLEMKGVWDSGHTYQMNGQEFGDYHPNPVRYYNYLNKLGFKLSDEAKAYAYVSNEKLQSAYDFDDLVNMFGHEYQLCDNFKPIL